MFVNMYFPGPMEGDTTGKDINGKRTELLQAIVEPLFFRPDGKPAVCYLESCDANGEVIARYMLTLSGKTGSITLAKRKPCSKTLYELKSSSGDNTTEDSDDDTE